MSKAKLLEKWKKELSLMETQKQAFIKTDRFRFATEIENLDKDIDMLEDIIFDLEYEIMNDSNLINGLEHIQFK